MKDISCVERALIFIEENLTRKISLEDIADAANYSQWYFHRLFRVLTGYCVNDYLRRRRLSVASHVLLYTSRSIRSIALQYQFESQEAFTRSFSSIAGQTPGRFRKQIAPLFQFPAISLDKTYKFLKKGAKNMKPRIETKAAFQVIGVSCRSNPSGSLHILWDEFMKRAQEIPHISDPHKAYQICLFQDADTANEEYTFIAGMEVSETSQVPPNMIAHEVPAAQYAVFEHHGLLDTMHQSYEYIFAVWLPENAWEMAEADSLEVYDERFKVGKEDSVFEIWIPLKAKSR
ncbi:MAG: AraC family transcriptional regulator [Candidatus Cloacimonadaceae bacterium]|nr:AraC family transcriptional regulator [Candidatus Cloacimonadaceae bacterium]